ncbi:MAG TPA: hypothetical protein VHD56_19575 [Tepidisphaeraceae bacterium]|nr:hypothetical protein [Tepidisphaeraceae bacterium]
MTDSIQQYQTKYTVRFLANLGSGKDGRVVKTKSRSAVKFIYDESVYRRELRAYQVLRQLDIEEVNGFQIPGLIRFDDAFRSIEMSIVKPPFLLDFAASYTRLEYERFEFTQEVLDERESYWSDIFGPRWPIVRTTCDLFTRETGLILLDLSLNNIKFEDQGINTL